MRTSRRNPFDNFLPSPLWAAKIDRLGRKPLGKAQAVKTRAPDSEQLGRLRRADEFGAQIFSVCDHDSTLLIGPQFRQAGTNHLDLKPVKQTVQAAPFARLNAAFLDNVVHLLGRRIYLLDDLADAIEPSVFCGDHLLLLQTFPCA
jgi:hypothetical protein